MDETNGGLVMDGSDGVAWIQSSCQQLVSPGEVWLALVISGSSYSFF